MFCPAIWTICSSATSTICPQATAATTATFCAPTDIRSSPTARINQSTIHVTVTAATTVDGAATKCNRHATESANWAAKQCLRHAATAAAAADVTQPTE